MEVKDKFEQISQAEGWTFINARRDFANLIDAGNFVADAIEGVGVAETVFILDPVRRSPRKDGPGIVYAGSFLVVTKSDLDQTYDDKFEKNIRPLFDKVLKDIPQALDCIYDVETWDSVEIINALDLNADGLFITFNLKSAE